MLVSVMPLVFSASGIGQAEGVHNKRVHGVCRCRAGCCCVVTRVQCFSGGHPDGWEQLYTNMKDMIALDSPKQRRNKSSRILPRPTSVSAQYEHTR